MLPVAFLAEKALAGAAKGHCLLGRIPATFVTDRKGFSLDLTSISSQQRPIIQVGVYWKLFHLALTERVGSVAVGAANGGL
jgi:hypothetical protein